MSHSPLRFLRREQPFRERAKIRYCNISLSNIEIFVVIAACTATRRGKTERDRRERGEGTGNRTSSLGLIRRLSQENRETVENSKLFSTCSLRPVQSAMGNILRVLSTEWCSNPQNNQDIFVDFETSQWVVEMWLRALVWVGEGPLGTQLWGLITYQA